MKRELIRFMKKYGLGYLNDTIFFKTAETSNISIKIKPEKINVYNFDELEFFAIFNKAFSAFRIRENLSQTLSHEQIHFDIAEIYIRKIKL